MRYRDISLSVARPISRLNESGKWWYDAPNQEVLDVYDHHWTDVEDSPTGFAKFSDDELSDIENSEYDDKWLANRVFAARWVRVVSDANIWYFQGHRLADIRKAVRDILPLDADNIRLVLEGPNIDAVLSGAAITRFLKTGRLPPVQPAG